MGKSNLNYIVEGEGEVLVFIHGLSDNLLYWEFLAANLKNDYKVIRFDLRGHGESISDDDKITMETYINDLKILLDDLNIKKANLVGFSLGGAVALEFCLKFPEIVTSLVLMSSFSKCDDNLDVLFNQIINNLESSFEDFYDFMISKVLCPDVILNNRCELEMLKEESAKNADLKAYSDAWRVCLDFDIDNRLGDIDVPVLILAGRYDDIFPLKYQYNLNSKIKNSKLIIFDNVKHNLLVGENNLKILNIIKKDVG